MLNLELIFKPTIKAGTGIGTAPITDSYFSFQASMQQDAKTSSNILEAGLNPTRLWVDRKECDGGYGRIRFIATSNPVMCWTVVDLLYCFRNHLNELPL
jgi:hypothetical protein